MKSDVLDAALTAVYEQMGVTVDRFVGDIALTHNFVAAVRARAGETDLDDKLVMRRLMNLRKAGRLPRLHRQYFGRFGSADNN